MRIRFNSHGFTLMMTFVLVLVVGAVAGAIIFHSFTRHRTSAISIASLKAAEISEAGLAIAIGGVKACLSTGSFVDDYVGLPRNAAEAGGAAFNLWYDNETNFPMSAQPEGTYSGNVKLIYTDADPTDGTRNDLDYSSDIDGNGDYRYLFEITGTVTLVSGEQVSRTVQGAVTYRLYNGADLTLGDEEGERIGTYFVFPSSSVLWVNANIVPGTYTFSYYGRYDNRESGPDAKKPDGTPRSVKLAKREDMVIRVGGSDPLYLPEWREYDNDPEHPNHVFNYSAFDDPADGNTINPYEFLIPYNEQDDTYRTYTYINENGTNVNPQYVFVAPVPDPEEENTIVELDCGFEHTYGTEIGDCEGDLDLEEGSTCNRFCDEVAVYGDGCGDSECYRQACRDACMIPPGYDIDTYDPEAGDFYFQLEHPDSEAKLMCDSPVCLHICVDHYQWVFSNSQCRDQCSGFFENNHGGSGTKLRQSTQWFDCMNACVDVQWTNSGSECHDLCDEGVDHRKGCIEQMAGAYQLEADPSSNPDQDVRKIAGSGALKPFYSQCMHMCKNIYNDTRCRDECDGRFLHRDVATDIVITPMNKIHKDRNYRFYNYVEDYGDQNCLDRNPPNDRYCEPNTQGSVGFGGAGTSENAFMIRPQNGIIQLIDIQIKFK
ncbi:hypothetical protein ACFL38_02750 [Candidatus Omnitrophota bacterium]